MTDVNTEMTETEVDGEESIVETAETAVKFTDVNCADYEGLDLIDVMMGKLAEAKVTLTALIDGTFTSKAAINKAVALHRGDLYSLRDGIQVTRGELLTGKASAGDKAGEAAKSELKAKKIAAAKKLMEEAEAL